MRLALHWSIVTFGYIASWAIVLAMVFVLALILYGLFSPPLQSLEAHVLAGVKLSY